MKTSEDSAGLVLLIEDNRAISEMVGEYLERRGFRVDYASDGAQGYQQAVDESYDAIVLDLMLPRLDGVELCRRLRQEAKKATPVLMLTARDTLDDKVRGLEAGGDDYLVKPFALQELEARLRALIRRDRRQVSTEVLRVADLVLDTATLRVTRAGQDLQLSPIGLRLLAILMRESPRVVSRRDIEREIWADGSARFRHLAQPPLQPAKVHRQAFPEAVAAHHPQRRVSPRGTGNRARPARRIAHGAHFHRPAQQDLGCLHPAGGGDQFRHRAGRVRRLGRTQGRTDPACAGERGRALLEAAGARPAGCLARHLQHARLSGAGSMRRTRPCPRTCARCRSVTTACQNSKAGRWCMSRTVRPDACTWNSTRVRSMRSPCSSARCRWSWCWW
jgi:DNA-binding response OmpR family regulator